MSFLRRRVDVGRRDNKATVCGGEPECNTMSYMKPTLTIRLPQDLRAELEAISREDDRPVSDIVRESLRRYIAIRQFRRLRGKVLPFAEAQGFLSDEDVFRALS